MRNTIKYYYNLDADNIRYENGIYIFNNYIFKELNNPINFELYNFYISNNLYLHKIIYNINNDYITKYENKNYILLRIEKNERISIDNIFNFIIDVPILDIKNWGELWEKKIDYYERNIINTKNKNILDVFPYYIGLGENAISIYKSNNLDTTHSICHNRMNNDYEFYSPDNIIIDYKVRDISEYIKKNFFIDTLDNNLLIKYLNSNNFMIGDYTILYARLLFPTYFFDCIENNEKIDVYVSKINQYEKFLNQMYWVLNINGNIPRIDWLIKKV